MGSWCLNVGGLWGCSWSQSTWQPWWHNSSVVISGCRSLSYQRRLHFLFGWSTACHNVCSGRLVSHVYLTCAILTFRTSSGDSQLPQPVSSSLTPSWSCSAWTKTWRWIMPYISGVIQYSNTPKSPLSGDSSTSIFQHIPTLQDTL